MKYAHLMWIEKRIVKLQKKIDKYKLAYIILLLILSGCVTTNPIRTTDDLKQTIMIQDREKIFKVYNNNTPNIIILAYEKVYVGIFDIAKNYLQYNKVDDNPTYDGFWIWLMKNLWYKDIFNKGDEFGIGQEMIDNRFNDKEYSEIKKNYELLEKMSNE